MVTTFLILTAKDLTWKSVYKRPGTKEIKEKRQGLDMPQHGLIMASTHRTQITNTL